MTVSTDGLLCCCYLGLLPPGCGVTVVFVIRQTRVFMIACAIIYYNAVRVGYFFIAVRKHYHHAVMFFLLCISRQTHVFLLAVTTATML